MSSMKVVWYGGGTQNYPGKVNDKQEASLPCPKETEGINLTLCRLHPQNPSTGGWLSKRWHIVALTMRSHQFQVAALVPDKKLDTFWPEKSFPNDQNILTYHPGPVSPSGGDGSPLHVNTTCFNNCMWVQHVLQLRYQSTMVLIPSNLRSLKWAAKMTDINYDNALKMPQ